MLGRIQDLGSAKTERSTPFPACLSSSLYLQLILSLHFNRDLVLSTPFKSLIILDDSWRTLLSFDNLPLELKYLRCKAFLGASSCDSLPISLAVGRSSYALLISGCNAWGSQDITIEFSSSQLSYFGSSSAGGFTDPVHT